MVKSMAPLRPLAIALTLLLLVAAAAWLLSGRGARHMDDADSSGEVQVVDALTGRPVGRAADTGGDPASALAAAPSASPPAGRHNEALVTTLAARGAGDMPMLAEMVANQPRGAGDDAAEARAAQLLSRHLRIAGEGHPLRVRCAAALCEVTGTVATPAAAIEGPALQEAVLAAGWTPGPVASAPAAGGGTDFLMYLNRESLQGEGR